MTKLKLSDLPLEMQKNFLKDKPSKYRARKTEIDGIKFASKKEANYYCELQLRQRAGEIKSFELQPAFVLQEAFVKNGVRIREIKYIADFKVFYPGGRVEIIDTKGFCTKDFLLKKKMFEYKYPDMELVIV